MNRRFFVPKQTSRRQRRLERVTAGRELLVVTQEPRASPAGPRPLAGQAGDAAGAAEAFRELLADMVRVLDPDHPHTLTARSNLTYWREQAGEAAGAADAFEELPNRVRVTASGARRRGRPSRSGQPGSGEPPVDDG